MQNKNYSHINQSKEQSEDIKKQSKNTEKENKQNLSKSEILSNNPSNGFSSNDSPNNDYEKLTFSQIQKALRKRDIKINGVRTRKDIELKKGDNIELIIYENEKNKKDEEYFNEVYSDENIIIINKKAGISVHEDRESEDNNLIDILKKKYNREIYLCHRIDRNTTGLLIVAKNDRALLEINKAINNKKIEKYYQAIVLGIPEKKSDKLIHYLKKDTKNYRVWVYNKYKNGLLTSITNYNLLDSKKISIENKDKKIELSISLLDISIETGRMHQIRAQLSHIGYPIIGDNKYGKSKINRLLKIKHQLLIAYKLIFHFDRNSPLYYLNNKIFEIENSLWEELKSFFSN